MAREGQGYLCWRHDDDDDDDDFDPLKEYKNPNFLVQRRGNTQATTDDTKTIHVDESQTNLNTIKRQPWT